MTLGFGRKPARFQTPVVLGFALICGAFIAIFLVPLLMLRPELLPELPRRADGVDPRKDFLGRMRLSDMREAVNEHVELIDPVTSTLVRGRLIQVKGTEAVVLLRAHRRTVTVPLDAVAPAEDTSAAATEPARLAPRDS